STSRRRARRRRAARARGTWRRAAPPTRRAAPRCASRTRSASRPSCALLGPSRLGADGFHDRADPLAQQDGVQLDGAVREQRLVDALLEEVTIRAGIREQLRGHHVLDRGRQATLVLLALATIVERRGRHARALEAPPPPRIDIYGQTFTHH